MTENVVTHEPVAMVGVASIEETFEVLYLRHRDVLVRYLRAHTTDDDEAMDLVATTFERAWVALRGPGIAGPPLPWLLRVARNAAIDRHRRRTGQLRLLDRLRQRPQPTAPPADVEALTHDADRAFRDRLRDLPDAQREALALRYGADLAIRDVAAQLGRTEAAAQQLISRGLARLRETNHDID